MVSIKISAKIIYLIFITYIRFRFQRVIHTFATILVSACNLQIEFLRESIFRRAGGCVSEGHLDARIHNILQLSMETKVGRGERGQGYSVYAIKVRCRRRIFLLWINDGFESLLSAFPLSYFWLLTTLHPSASAYFIPPRVTCVPMSEQTMKEKIEKYQDFDLYVTMNIYIKNFIYLYLNEIYRNLFPDF